jgi:hypothetical protein
MAYHFLRRLVYINDWLLNAIENLLEQLTVVHLVIKLLAFYESREFITVFTRTYTYKLEYKMSEISPVHIKILFISLKEAMLVVELFLKPYWSLVSILFWYKCW